METEVQRDHNKTKFMLLLSGAETLNEVYITQVQAFALGWLPSPSTTSPKALLRSFLQLGKPAVL